MDGEQQTMSSGFLHGFLGLLPWGNLRSLQGFRLQVGDCVTNPCVATRSRLGRDPSRGTEASCERTSDSHPPPDVADVQIAVGLRLWDRNPQVLDPRGRRRRSVGPDCHGWRIAKGVVPLPERLMAADPSSLEQLKLHPETM